MHVLGKSEDEQTALWNGIAGRSWVELQGTLDVMFKPFEDLLVEAVTRQRGTRVLDVGCGTGSTTLAIARRLGGAGRCVGIDISEPMLEQARLRAERDGTQASFIRADAELHRFRRASFDSIISRFGVMFFGDSVRAFANLRSAAQAAAELAFIAWRSPSENPFMTTAERAVAAWLPNLPPRDPDAPGQFRFADPNRVRGILDASGWTDVELRPIDIDCAFPEADLTRYVTQLGPVGRILHAAETQTRDQMLALILPAFAPYVDGAMVRFSAACWSVRARAPAAIGGHSTERTSRSRGSERSRHGDGHSGSVSGRAGMALTDAQARASTAQCLTGSARTPASLTSAAATATRGRSRRSPAARQPANGVARRRAG